MPEINETSQLAASPLDVWAAVSTMDGVNAELAPLVQMTVPQQARGLNLADAPLGCVAFDSWLLAFGLVPFDCHHLQLERIEPGRGFLERSTSWLQALWEHERTLTPLPGGGTELRDRVRFEPRISSAAPLTSMAVAHIFRHRHARLRERFGASA